MFRSLLLLINSSLVLSHIKPSSVTTSSILPIWWGSKHIDGSTLRSIKSDTRTVADPSASLLRGKVTVWLLLKSYLEYCKGFIILEL